MIDPLGKLIQELRANATVAALTTRIRGGEPAVGDAQSKAAGYLRFVVLTRLGNDRLPRVPVQFTRIGVRAYGTTYQDAAALYGAISDAVHNVGPRIGATGVVIYRSFDDVGSGASEDPDTGQPYESGVILLAAATQAAA